LLGGAGRGAQACAPMRPFPPWSAGQRFPHAARKQKQQASSKQAANMQQGGTSKFRPAALRSVTAGQRLPQARAAPPCSDAERRRGETKRRAAATWGHNMGRPAAPRHGRGGAQHRAATWGRCAATRRRCAAWGFPPGQCRPQRGAATQPRQLERAAAQAPRSHTRPARPPWRAESADSEADSESVDCEESADCGS
jgi:hypothetical protein